MHNFKLYHAKAITNNTVNFDQKSWDSLKLQDAANDIGTVTCSSKDKTGENLFITLLTLYWRMIPDIT